jgi:3-oxoacyl-[acyl-carrier-protein] synthase-3
MKHLSILGMGSAHPDTIITNEFLESLNIGTSAQWIEEKIGVKERVTTLPLDYIFQTRNADIRLAHRVASASPTDLAKIASYKALENAGINATQVGMILCNTCTPRSLFPSEGVRIAQALGIEERSVQIRDVITACPAFALHVHFLSQFNCDDLPEYILCVCTATFTQIVNYNDRTDGAIWGDGAAAWVMSAKYPGRLSVLDTTFMADPSRASAVVIDRFGHFHQDGRAVRDFSVRQTVRLIKRLEQGYNLNWNKDIFIGHQANRTMLEQVAHNRNIPATNHWHNVTYLGNQAAAGAPAVLAGRWSDIVTGQRIAIAVVGAGLSWGSILLEAV